MLPGQLVALCLVVIMADARGQSERMAKLQATYEEELKKATDSVDQQYEKALLALQQKYISLNRLEEALLVKKEIEWLKSGKPLIEPEPTPPAAVPVPPSSSPPSPDKSSKLSWMGDHKIVTEKGRQIFQLTGRANAPVMLMLPLDDLKKRFPNGLKIRYEYRTSGFIGTALEMRCDFPGLKGLFTFRKPTLVTDGEWNEYIWPFNDTKGQDMMNFQILLDDGEGSIEFRDFEFIAN